ncbi:polyunsaturated fatty acid 5-lipoxygenase-like [Montipora capricornis]|uniref:polyunsaturated fatty acid 5-lipoxygenase-like n=1 Tax=Montipora capricornis TaxID=246305 RepID=UPI0035F1824B
MDNKILFAVIACLIAGLVPVLYFRLSAESEAVVKELETLPPEVEKYFKKVLLFADHETDGKELDSLWSDVEKFMHKMMDCEVSLPQKASWFCKFERSWELRKLKKIWKVKKSPSGFVLLDMPAWMLTAGSFVYPLTRSCISGYIETVFLSKSSELVYDVVDKLLPGNISYHYYGILSTYFEKVSLLGGKHTRRPSLHEAFNEDKRDWISDKYFTQQRLAGVNPMSLKRVTFHGSYGNIGLDWNKLKKNLNPNFGWEAAVQKAFGMQDTMTLEEAISQGRIYALRYEFCDDLPKEPKDLTDDDPRRTMWPTLSPIALFASAPDKVTGNHLVPVAIQMDFTPDSAVYTPDDGGLWMLAKLNVQVTDLGYGQIVEHLAKVHFMMDPFCVVLKVAISLPHPLHQILRYHCREVTVPNTIGTPKLIGNGQYMDQLFAFGHNGTNRLLKDAYPISTWDITDFRSELKKRGVDDSDLLPYFPYRDDGEQILKVIEQMVTDYVDLYYHDDEDVKKDYEFQNYLDKLSTDGSDIGGIQGLPASIRTKDELCEILTRIISHVSIQHAAVNYPLSDYGQYIPNLPTKLYNDTRVVDDDKFSVLRLPNGNTSAIESSFSNILGLYRFDSLFEYGNELEDQKAAELINRYYGKLMNDVQPRMQKENQKRIDGGDLSYPYFIPKWLTNGIQT